MKKETISDRDEMRLIDRILEIRKDHNVVNVELDKFSFNDYGLYEATIYYGSEEQ